MSVSRQPKLGRLWLGVPLALALVALAWGLSGSVHADGTGTRLTLNARGDGVTCDDPSEPSECVAPLGGQFKLAVDIMDAPEDGYVAVATQFDFTGLTWVPAAIDVENTWPDNGFPQRDPVTPGFNTPTQVVSHGGLTATTAPLPVSHHEGSVVEITVSCPADEDSFEMALVNYDPALSPTGTSITLADGVTIVGMKTVGEREVDIDGDGNLTPVPVNHLLTINCEEVPPTPTQGPTTLPTATLELPVVGYGGDQAAGGDAGSWLIVGVLASCAAILGLSGWRFARRRAG